MANFKVKYASQLNIDRDWAFAPGHWFKLDWSTLTTEYPDPACYLVALDDRQLNLIHHLVSIFPRYYRNWGYTTANLDTAEWDQIEGFINELEHCLMSGCDVSQLNTNLDRIATAVEDLVQVEGGEVKTLQQILDELDNADLGDVADLVEILEFLKALVPSFNPTISLAGLIEAFTAWRFREGVVNLLMDIAISQRAQATAQGGIGFHGLYDIAASTGGWIAAQTAKSGGPLTWFTGAAAWLWLKIRPAQLDGWTSWVDTITGLALGSIRGAEYNQDTTLGEIRDKLDELPNQTAAITGLGTLGNFDANSAALVAKLEEVRAMLETRLTAETTAANSRAQDLEAVLDAVENVLGGTYQPS